MSYRWPNFNEGYKEGKRGQPNFPNREPRPEHRRDLTQDMVSRTNFGNLAYCLSSDCPGGFNGILTSLKSCSEDIGRDNVPVIWNHQTEELVKLLKICIDCQSYGSFSPEAMVGLREISPDDWKELSSAAVTTLVKLCLRLDGAESYNFYACLFDNNTKGSLSVTCHFKGQRPEHYRTVAYGHLMHLIRQATSLAKKTLAMAETKHTVLKTVPYTGFSAAVGNTLRDLLRTFLQMACDDKGRELDQMMVYCTLELIISVTPFPRLDPSFLEDVVEYLRICLTERPQVAPPVNLLGIADILLSTEMKEQMEEFNYFTSFPKKNMKDFRLILAEKAIQYLSYWCSVATLDAQLVSRKNMVVRSHLRILTSLAKDHFHIIEKDVKQIMTLIIYALSQGVHLEQLCCTRNIEAKYTDIDLDGILDVVYSALLLLDTLTGAVSDHVAEQSNSDTEAMGHSFLQLWFKFFELMPSLMQSVHPHIPQLVVTCYSSVKEDLFNLMAVSNRQALFMSNVLGFCRDPRADVRGQAGRCLALMLHFVALIQSEPCFLLDALDVIEVMLSKGELQTRGAFAWALANVTEALMVFYKEGLPFIQSFPLFKRIFYLAKQCTLDTIKIRYNGHRCLGYLLGWIPLTDLPKNMVARFVREAIDLLQKQVNRGKDFKARWNACHALGNVVENTKLLDVFGSELTNIILEALSKGASKSENFKERIQCLRGICQIHKREYFGSKFSVVWERVLNVSAIPENRRDMNVDKLSKEVETKLSACLIHLIGLVGVDDLVTLETILLNKSETLKNIIGAGAPLDNCTQSEQESIHKAKANLKSLRRENPSEGVSVLSQLEDTISFSSGLDGPASLE